MAANSPAGTNFSLEPQSTSSSRSPTVQCVWEVDDDSSPSGGPLNLTFSRIVGPYGRDRDASTPAAETADLVSILSNATLHDLERIVQGDTEARQQQLLDREMGLLALDERMARGPALVAREEKVVGVSTLRPDHASSERDAQNAAANTPLPASDEETATARSERQARQRAAYRYRSQLAATGAARERTSDSTSSGIERSEEQQSQRAAYGSSGHRPGTLDPTVAGADAVASGAATSDDCEGPVEGLDSMGKGGGGSD